MTGGAVSQLSTVTVSVTVTHCLSGGHVSELYVNNEQFDLAYELQ
jgi:hypothetical protein